jgi:cell division ATPase FtsA
VFQTKKDKIFGILDVGSGSVKFLIFKETEKKTVILAKTLCEYKGFGIFDGKDFEIEMIGRAIEEVLKQIKKKTNTRFEELIVGFPPHIFKARIVPQVFKRKHSEALIDKQEKTEILNAFFEQARKEVAEDFSKQAGILPQDIHFLTTEILYRKVDGYRVPQFFGFGGRRLESGTLVTFLPRYYLKKAKKIIRGFGFKTFKIVHESQGLARALAREQNTLFLDIGSDFTQIFLVKQGELVLASDFKFGARNFSEALCEHLGMPPNMAKDFSQRYQTGYLSEEVRQRIRQIFLQEAWDWHFNLERKLQNRHFFESISCFGGGAYYPEIKEILEKKQKTPVKTLDLKDVPDVEDKVKGGRILQFIPSIFLTYVV